MALSEVEIKQKLVDAGIAKRLLEKLQKDFGRKQTLDASSFTVSKSSSDGVILVSMSITPRSFFVLRVSKDGSVPGAAKRLSTHQYQVLKDIVAEL